MASTDIATPPLVTASATTSPTTHPPHLHALAAQIHYNLLHQHDWDSLATHIHSPIPPHHLFPRPLLSGLPPHHIYTHPDTQLQALMTNKTTGDTPETEWVLPTHIEEKWTLQRLCEVFEGVPAGVEGRKRVLLATVGPDGTVVYYILHEGIVKPRQN
ncbi:MAG: hypothetical protein M1840_003599 [Geoglossum simile]|nr:MAG: hypothetical protein M1840_003599 [Geoglossum simile]